MGPEYRDVVRVRRQAGQEARRSEHPEDLRPVHARPPACKADGRNKNAQEIWKILVDQQYGIGTVGQSPARLGVRLVSRTGWATSPARVCNAQHCRTPGNSHPETWYFKA